MVDLWQKMDLSGEAPQPVGNPGSLPNNIKRLARSTLADMSELAPSDPTFDGIGYWPVVDDALPVPSTTQIVSSTPSVTVNADLVQIERSYALVPRPAHQIAALTEQRKVQLKQSVNQERDRRWPGTVNCDLAGDGSLVIPADARNDTDLRNIQAVTTAAQVIAGTPDAVLKFRDANDVTHNLSPEEVIALGLTIQAHVQSFYEKAWALKDNIDSMTSAELDQLDVTSNTHWE